MSDNEQLIRENKDTLETVAQSDLRSAKWASKLLESIEGDTSYSEKESTQEPITPKREQSDTGVKESVFAY